VIELKFVELYRIVENREAKSDNKNGASFDGALCGSDPHQKQIGHTLI
jgi:hypothetical protein